MSAALSVRIGNRWNICYDAQTYVKSILDRVARDRWAYYLKDCLKSDERVLLKLTEDNPLSRWLQLVDQYQLSSLVEGCEPLIKHLVTTDGSKRLRVASSARKLAERLGYKE